MYLHNQPQMHLILLLFGNNNNLNKFTMKKILILLASIVLFSCNDDDVKSIDQLNTGPKVVGFKSVFESVSYFSNQGVKDHVFPVKLIGLGNGSLPTTAITVDYEVDLVNSTAVEGVEFNFANATRKISILPGTDFATIDLKVNSGSLNPTSKTELILKLKQAAGANIAYESDILKVVFIGCNSQIGSLTGGNYTVTSTNAGGVVRAFTNEVITLIAPNTFRTGSTGTFSLATPTGSTGHGYDLVDVCGDVTIPNQNLFRFYSNIVSGTDAFSGNDGEVVSANLFRTRYAVSSQSTYLSEYVR